VLKDKVLYIGHFREVSGWGKAGQGYIHALKAAGFDVAARAIKVSNQHAPLDDVILEAEANSAAGARYCIQHVLPHHMEYSGEFDKCVGLVALDTRNINMTDWYDKLMLMDEVWVPNTQSATDFEWESGKRTRCIPHAFDLSAYSKEYEKVELGYPDSTYVFYTIADLTRRKNLSAIVKAFHLAFPRDTDVALVIKAGKQGWSAEDVFNEVNSMTQTVKNGLRIYKNLEDYHNEMVLCEHLNEETLYRLHASCDCYVSASYNEAFCIPAFEAMAMNKTVIASNCGGPRDYLNGYSHLYRVEGNWEPTFGMMDTFDNLFTSNEDWYNVDIRYLVRCMQEAYKYRDEKPKGNNAHEYSYAAVGKIINDALR
jgi:glycosyltransferase involved in cell wall biosynthesis